jgi:hypothetical protein
MRDVRARFWLESGFAVAAGVLGIATVFWRDWIEAVLRVDPDHGNGALEWLIVGTLIAASGCLSRGAWFESRRPRPSVSRS